MGWYHETYQNVTSPREWKKGQDPTFVKVKTNLTVRVLWLCACVRYWPGRGLVYVCPLL